MTTATACDTQTVTRSLADYVTSTVVRRMSKGLAISFHEWALALYMTTDHELPQEQFEDSVWRVGACFDRLDAERLIFEFLWKCSRGMSFDGRPSSASSRLGSWPSRSNGSACFFGSVAEWMKLWCGPLGRVPGKRSG